MWRLAVKSENQRERDPENGKEFMSLFDALESEAEATEGKLDSDVRWFGPDAFQSPSILSSLEPSGRKIQS